ncbi:MAG: hypothetical protein GYA52_11470, partial [Chloroflexi bacterium]|nr:hypothetical protein [Chloroflexota bacterium]
MDDFTDFETREEQTLQSQPHNKQAEEAILGSILINPESYFDVAQVLEADNFYIIRNRWIWEVFVHLYEERIPIDLLTVSEELEKRNQ